MMIKAFDALVNQSDEKAVTLWNSLSFEREALVELPKQFVKGARTLEGEMVPLQVQGCDGTVVKALVNLPACGAVSLIPMDIDGSAKKQMDREGSAEGLPAGLAVNITENPEGFVMENRLVKAVVNHTGEVLSFILKSSGREFAAEPMNHFRMYKDVARLFDAWDIDSNYVRQEVKALEDAKTEMVSKGLEGVLKVTGRISKSCVQQYIRLEADSTRLVFDTIIDWKELHRLLKVCFPVDVYAENGINEMQFGYVERPAHRSRDYDKDRFEVCNHRYSAFCDGTHGAAVLNDCKYGISMNKNALELTLLRAPSSPEMQADNRVHRFAYAFTAWEGSFLESNVVQQGYEFNVRPQISRGSIKAFSAVSIDKKNVILDTMKPAEDGNGDIILRFYESKKAAVMAKVHCTLCKKAYLCNMLENVTEEIPVEDGSFMLTFRAFEIKTVRIKM